MNLETAFDAKNAGSAKKSEKGARSCVDGFSHVISMSPLFPALSASLRCLRRQRFQASFRILLPLFSLGLVGAAQAQPPRLEPLPPPVAVDPARVELGRHLFFESRLSGDGSRSCASCHIPEKGYADGRPLARGYNGTEHFRNTPGLLSVRLKRRLMWDGRRDGAELSEVVRDMVTAAHYMNGNGGIIEERVRQLPPLLALYRQAYGLSSEPEAMRVYAAIADFVRSLDAAETPVDAALRGDPDALSREARTGMSLFAGKAGCVRCHHGPLLSDGERHRLGVPQHPALREPLRAITLQHYLADLGVPGHTSERTDPGAYVATGKAQDRGRFATPGLRALAHTGPYMHNGVFATLEDVVDFYDRGGGAGGELRPLGLTADERKALGAFLRALSGPLQRQPPPEPFNYGSVAGASR